jgi:hypothetical protein
LVVQSYAVLKWSCLVLILKEDGTITYRGKDVGRITTEGNEVKVELNLTYSATDPADAIAPVSYLATGLRKLESPPSPIVLQLITTEAEIDRLIDLPTLLIERTIRQDGYVWQFHKTDVDPWPSALHAHDYERGLVLDAITGEIFVAATKKLSRTLSEKSRVRLHDEIRACKDLEATAARAGAFAALFEQLD